MYKRMAVVLCILLVMAHLTGCGTGAGGGSGQESGQTTVADETVEEASSGTSADSTGGTAAGTVTESTEQSDRPLLQLSTMYMRETDEKNKTVYVHGSHDCLRLSEDSRKQFAKLAQALDDCMAEESREVKSRSKDYAARYKEDETAKEMAPKGFEIKDRLFVRRADRHVLSVLEDHFDFGGGVHGMYSFTTLNLDAETGKAIPLSDIITDRNRLAELLKSKLKEENPDAVFFDNMGETIDKMAAEVKEDQIDYGLTWTLDPQGISFYFSPYDIGPWAAGAFTTTILYDQEEGLFTDKYRPEKGQGQVAAFPADRGIDVDLDGDKKIDRVSISSNMTEDERIKDFTISVNKKHLTIDDLYGYDVDPRFLLTADGKAYVYTWCSQDNDYIQLHAFDVTSGSPVPADPAALSEVGSFEGGEGEDYLAWTSLIQDPDHMVLGTRINLLSTYNGSKIYSAQEGPLPKSTDKAYTINSEITLVSVKEISACPVDEKGTVSDKPIKIPSGSSFLLKYTDGESYVDAQLKDGSMVRLPVTGSYPQYINGVNAEELFEQLYFAG